MKTPPTTRKTKIVATIGPATREPDVLQAMIRTGMNVARINCSHSSAEAIRADVSRIRRAASVLEQSVAILLDLQGPKIRTGPCEAPLELARGDVLTLHMDPDRAGEGTSTGCTWTGLAGCAQVGEPVLFADGALEGKIVAVRPSEVDIEMSTGGSLGARKGINLPQTHIDMPALTDKDEADLATGLAAGVDYVALSFVRDADDLDHLHRKLRELGQPHMPVIAKIEKPQAVDNIDAILTRVAGIMVARGDLGVEMPFEQVPIIQKQLITAANRSGAIVITATQMLDSMERHPRPTRAEATDVANAILDGTDAVMLSGETSVGLYPLEAVRTMDSIARVVEQSPNFKPPPLEDLPAMSGAENTVCRAACYAVREVPRPLVVFTMSGNTAVKAAKARPPQGILAITHEQQVADRLSLVWGVRSVRIAIISGTEDLILRGEAALLANGLVHDGQEVVLLAGQAPVRGATNMMKVDIIGS
jgi:pyruvate kinase